MLTVQKEVGSEVMTVAGGKQRRLQVGDRARSKQNGRIGTIDAMDGDPKRRLNGLHYGEASQDRYLTHAQREGAHLASGFIERA